MTERFHCPYLDDFVELTAERRAHIELKHSEVLPGHIDAILEALRDPTVVVQSRSSTNARLFVRGYHAWISGGYIVVVVVTDRAPSLRSWVVTAYFAGELPTGDIEWLRS